MTATTTVVKTVTIRSDSTGDRTNRCTQCLMIDTAIRDDGYGEARWQTKAIAAIRGECVLIVF